MMQPHTSSQHPLGVDQDAIAVHNVTRIRGGDERHKVGKLLPLAGDWGGGGGGAAWGIACKRQTATKPWLLQVRNAQRSLHPHLPNSLKPFLTLD